MVATRIPPCRAKLERTWAGIVGGMSAIPRRRGRREGRRRLDDGGEGEGHSRSVPVHIFGVPVEILPHNGSCTVRTVVYGTYMSDSLRFEMRLSPELAARLDVARGDMPRATYVKKALESGLVLAGLPKVPSRAPRKARHEPQSSAGQASAVDYAWERQQKLNKGSQANKNRKS
jgi:hypothetical protein